MPRPLSDDQRAIVEELEWDAMFGEEDELSEEEEAALREQIARMNAEECDAHYAHQAWEREQMARPEPDFSGYTDDDPPW